MKNKHLLLILFLISSIHLSAQQPGSGYSLNFNGMSNAVNCGDSVFAACGLSNFSTEGWYNFNTLGANMGIMGNWKLGWPPYFYIVYGFFSTNDLTVAFHSGDGANRYATWAGANLTGWHHIATTFNRSGNITIYVDGIQRATTSIVYANGINLNLTTSNFLIGSIGLDASFNAVYKFKGHIDEIRVWQKVLTQQEIRDNMCKKLKGTEPMLIGYWRFDEGAGTIVYDSSPIGNNGTAY